MKFFYSYGKESQLLKFVKDLLNLYKLPINIFKNKNSKKLIKIQDEIYKGIFLDKKK